MEENEKDLLTDEQLEKDPEGESVNWEEEAHKARATAKRYHSSHKQLQELKKAQAEAEAEAKKKNPANVPVNNTNEFHYAEKAFLRASGIKPDEYELVFEAVRTTGKTIEEVLENGYFQSELQKKREDVAAKNAIPDGTKRAGASPRDSVEYWMAKIDTGEATVMSVPDVELRRKVTNARIARAKNTSQFTENPIV